MNEHLKFCHLMSPNQREASSGASVLLSVWIRTRVGFLINHSWALLSRELCESILSADDHLWYGKDEFSCGGSGMIAEARRFLAYALCFNVFRGYWCCRFSLSFLGSLHVGQAQILHSWIYEEKNMKISRNWAQLMLLVIRCCALFTALYCRLLWRCILTDVE